DEAASGSVLARTDGAPLPADDPALPVIGGELDGRPGRPGRVASGQALHTPREDVADPPLGLALRLLLDLANPAGGIVLGLLLDFVQEHLLGLRSRHSRDALESLRELL